MTSTDGTPRQRGDGPPGVRSEPWYELTLLVSGASEISARAITDTRRLCDRYLVGRYQMSVVDVHDNPAVDVAGELLAAPTLLKVHPQPVQKIVGNLSRTGDVLRALGVPDADADARGAIGDLG